MASVTTHPHEEHEHPTLDVYIRIAVILAIITGIEVAIYYIPAMQDILVPVLIALSAIKFVVVVGYFMHLKFDDSFLTFVFGAALIVSIIMFIALWVVMHFDAATIFHGNMSIFPDKPEAP